MAPRGNTGCNGRVEGRGEQMKQIPVTNSELRYVAWLYNWKAVRVSRLFGVSDRTAYRWLSGERDMPHYAVILTRIWFWSYMYPHESCADEACLKDVDSILRHKRIWNGHLWHAIQVVPCGRESFDMSVRCILKEKT